MTLTAPWELPDDWRVVGAITSSTVEAAA